MRSVAFGLLAGGALGGMLSVPVVRDKLEQQHDVEEGRSDPRASMPRRIAGFAANFVAPALMLALSSRAGTSQAMRGAMMTAAAAIPGAYWGARQLADV